MPMPDDEIEMRSVLMRLYHSWYLKEASYPAVHVNGQAPKLVRAGWIEASGDGWRITESGILAWAQMNRRMLGHQWAIRAAQFDELRARLDISIQYSGVCRKEGCNQPRKKAANGTEYMYCQVHMQEKWAADKRKRYSNRV